MVRKIELLRDKIGTRESGVNREREGATQESEIQKSKEMADGCLQADLIRPKKKKIYPSDASQKEKEFWPKKNAI